MSSIRIAMPSKFLRKLRFDKLRIDGKQSRVLVGLVGLLTIVGCGKEQQTDTLPSASSTNAAPSTSSTSSSSAAGSPGTSSSSSASAASPAVKKLMLTTNQLDGITKANSNYKIVLIVKTQNNPFFKPMIDAFKQTAADLGAQAEVEAPAKETDVEQQVALVQTEINNGAKAILIAPADSKALVPALKAAQEKGIVIVNLDNRLDPGTVQAQGLELGGYIGADNEEGGKLAGEEMIAALNGSGKVAILEGIRGVDNAEARKRGFLGAVTTNLTIAATETAEWDTEKAYAQTQNILKAHPDITGIFCANDNMAIGAMKAVAEAGKKGAIKIIGYDNIPGVKSAIDSGELTATIEQHPERMGKYGLKLAVGILNGGVRPGGELLVPLETIKKH